MKRLVVGSAKFFAWVKQPRLHDRKTKDFKAIKSSDQSSVSADHVTSTGHNLKWDHLELVARGRSLIYHAPELGPLRTGLSRQTVNQILVVAL